MRDLDDSVAGRLWTIVLIISGVAVLGYATTSLVALAVEGTVRDYFRSRRMRVEIDKLGDHQIICGYGRVGRQVAEEFALDGVPFVVIDQDPKFVEECLSRGYLALLGEAADGTLEEAGIRRARVLAAAVDSDADTSSSCSRPASSTRSCTSSPAPRRTPRPRSWRSRAPTAPSPRTPSGAAASPPSPPSPSW